MRILPAQIVDVQGHQSVVGEALEEFVSQIDVEATNHRPSERNVVLESRAPG